ncbi:MAG: hypothetical protein HETSPECPRED_002697 [Heterodermia speciosa]|uniref:Lytic polysaccharide monooxygenase n=1 Tax=Heterodermia speciosa TaxID=116794 RepID=A0A8H3F0H4_9LECA|nr:MAG: hypothetical protein HETSPECPRED_002697 [Heterodermia speciosa]
MRFNKALMALLGSGLASAHMIMKTPTPYGASSMTNGPLAADGSDYPCKQRPGVYDKGSASNTMAVGSPQTLSFTGSAVHGGGSCQLSLTKDLKPTKDTDFRVILSIEGGCPANTAGNLPPDEHGSGASTFQYSIPQDVAPGDYTLAWTWFNKLGNREMYMNCAPITVTGGSKKRNALAYDSEDNLFAKRDLSTLPKMFTANIQSVSGDCHTVKSSDLAFPDPGAVVQKKGNGTLVPPTGDCKAVSGTSSGAGAGPGSGSGSGSGAVSAAIPSTAPSGAAGEAQAASGSALPSVAASPSAASNGSVPTIGLDTHTILATAVPTPSAAGTAIPSAAGSVVPSAAGSVVPSAAGSVVPSAAGSAVPSAAGSVVPSAAGSVVPSAAASAIPSQPAAASPSGATSSQSCSAGSVVCSPDGSKYGICDNGRAIMQPVARGTKCSGGILVHAKRTTRFQDSPIRRRGGGMGAR